MSDEKYRRGNKNPHIKMTQKKPCEKCGQSVDHYGDGTISKHKVYVYETKKGVTKRTTKWSYCSNKRWY